MTTDSHVASATAPAPAPPASTGLRIAPLTLPAPQFSPFTFPRYRGLLSGTELPETVSERIAIGAWLGDSPVGLAFLSRPNGESRRRRLLSIMVSPLLRRQGMATRLLREAESLAVADGAKALDAVHSSRMASSGAFEALLRRAGWSAPKEIEYRLAGKAGWSLKAKADWGDFVGRITGRGYQTTTWNELTDADHQVIGNIVQACLPEPDRAFDPLKIPPDLPVIPELSLALRRHGEIVGWVLGSKGAIPDTVYYSHGYVLHKVRRAGWLVAGVREVCERQCALMGPETISVFETAANNADMRRFMERQLKPYSLWTDSRYLSEKSLA